MFRYKIELIYAAFEPSLKDFAILAAANFFLSKVISVSAQLLTVCSGLGGVTTFLTLGFAGFSSRRETSFFLFALSFVGATFLASIRLLTSSSKES